MPTNRLQIQSLNLQMILNVKYLQARKVAQVEQLQRRARASPQADSIVRELLRRYSADRLT